MTHRRSFLSAMTLVELLATMAILGLLATVAIPSFRRLQVRQSLTTATKHIQSAFYRLQQLALAPAGGEESYDVVGYGLVVQRVKPGTDILTYASCQVEQPDNDFLMFVKYVRSRTSASALSYLPVSAAGGDSANCRIQPKDFPNDFYVLPAGVRLDPTSLPDGIEGWLVSLPLQSAGTTFGTLPTDPFLNPLERGPACLGVLIGSGGSGQKQTIVVGQGSNGITVATQAGEVCS